MPAGCCLPNESATRDGNPVGKGRGRQQRYHERYAVAKVLAAVGIRNFTGTFVDRAQERNEHHRASRAKRAAMRHRTEQCSSGRPTATVAEHQQVGVAGLVEQNAGRVTLLEADVDLPTGFVTRTFGIASVNHARVSASNSSTGIDTPSPNWSDWSRTVTAYTAASVPRVVLPSAALSWTPPRRRSRPPPSVAPCARPGKEAVSVSRRPSSASACRLPSTSRGWNGDLGERMGVDLFSRSDMAYGYPSAPSDCRCGADRPCHARGNPAPPPPGPTSPGAPPWAARPRWDGYSISLLRVRRRSRRHESLVSA